jgi:hypothetical protein
MVEHAELLVEWFGEFMGIRSFRKHTGWYLKGYPAGPEVRSGLASSESVGQVVDLLATLDATALPHDGATRMTRGHSRGPRQVKLPHGYLQGSWDEDVVDEVAVSGG